MKTSVRQLPLFAALVSFLTLTFAVFAQEPAEKPAPPAPDAPPAAAAPAAPAPSDEPKSEKAELRRLDEPSPENAESADDADDTSAETVAPAKPAADEAPVPAKSKPGKRAVGHRAHRGNGDARVCVWDDATLAAGESADAVISIGGSSTAHGHVNDAVVSIAGSSTSDAEVGNAVVSIAGDTRVNGGRVGDSAVAVLGSNYVNARVEHAVVAVLGNVELGPKADVGEVVCVGGVVKRDAQAIVRGQVNQVGFAVPFIGSHFDGLHAWFRHCLILGRPLAFGPNLMWAWWIAFGLLAFYIVLALMFPRGVERCAETFEQRPGYSILTAFLVTLLTPLAAILLLITVIGAPALLVFLFIAGLFGKAVMLAWIGRRITTRLGAGPLAAPAFAVLIGGLIVLLLYTVPFLGFLLAKLLSWLGVGVVVYTLILGWKRNKAAARAASAEAATAAATANAANFVAPVPPAPQPSVMPDAASPVASVEMPGVASEVPPISSFGSAVPPPVIPIVPPPVFTVPPVAPAPVRPVHVPAATLPRAGFWIRLAASLLDAVLVGVAIHLLPEMVRPDYPLVFAVYCVVLWALKATTVGGIVCGLKVVRLDDRPLDWPTALVRALGGFLSLIVGGLGFIWVAFDDQKQSWHDKIAGTVVVQVPKGVSLV